MLRYLLSATLLLSAFTSTGQDKKSDVKKVEEKKIDYKVTGAPLPNVILETFDTVKTAEKKHRRHKKQERTSLTRLVTNKDLEHSKNIILMIFNPLCGHCDEMTRLLTKNEDQLKKTTVVMLASSKMRAYMPDFIKNQKLIDHPNFIAGIDSLDVTKETYLYSALPQLNIYDRDHKLVKVFTGDVSIDSVAKYLK